MVYPLKSHHGPGVSCIVIGEKVMGIKEKYDGRSRPTNKVYEKRWEEIFGKKEEEDLKESYKQSLKNKQDRKEKEKCNIIF